MADIKINDIFEYDPELIKNILWQYEHATALKSLISQKSDWYDVNLQQFWKKILKDFLNIKTANDWGLNLWGKILSVPRVYPIENETVTISTELYRRLILGKLQLIRSTGTPPEINKYLNFIFSDHITQTAYSAIVRDNQDMTVSYILSFKPTTEELALIFSRTFFPTPAAVLDKIYLIEQDKIFGFKDTGFQPWNQAPFWDGRNL